MEYNLYVKEPNNFATLQLDESFNDFGYFIVDDILYLYGGGESDYAGESKKYMYIYDIHKNTWEKFEDKNIPNDLMNASSCVYNGNVYFFGGYKNSFIRRYNVTINEWNEGFIGYINSNSNINMTNIFCGKPYVIGNKAYFGGICNFSGDQLTKCYEFDLENEKLNTTSICYNFSQSASFVKFDLENKQIFQIIRGTFSGHPTNLVYATMNFGANATSANCYRKDYSTATTNGFVHSIVNDYDENNVIDIRPDIDNNNRLTIKILDSTNNFSTIELCDSCDEVEHYFEDPIYLTIGESQSTNIIDSKGQIFIPFFSNDGKTEIKLLAIAKPDYIINSDQIIETTIANNIKQIDSVVESSIEYELKDNTEIRIALSIDGKTTYKYFDGNNWLTCTNKNLVKNNQGMTPNVFFNLTESNYKKLITTTSDIDVLVSLYTKDSNNTPKIKSISFKTSKKY